jgi:hypothetical protein
MGNFRMGIPKDLIIFLKSNFQIDNFIETGTYKAQSAIWASGVFKHIQTIENSELIFNQNRGLISKYPNISFHFGHSKNILSKILPNLNGNTIFWLDAHWSGSDTYGEHDECPLIEEINAIIESNPNHFILIDDARLFLMPPPLPHQAKQWPSIAEIVITLNKSNYYIVVYDDVIIAVPNDAKERVCEYCQQISTLNWNQRSGEQIKDGMIQIKDGILKLFK